MTAPDAISAPVASRARGGAAAATRRLSLRFRVLGAVLLINAAAAMLAGAVVVRNARTAAEREMTASVEMAERMVTEMAERMVDAPAGPAMAGWPLHLRHLRHVRISLTDGQGNPLPARARTAEGRDEADAPAWFERLVGVREVAREVEVRRDGVLLGRVRIAGVPDDEVAEVWEDVSDFAAVALAVNAALIGALYLALGRVRGDLGRLSGALEELERNRYSCRVEPPRTRELAEVAERINALAAALGAARAENQRLSARLVTLQEDERRQIARDLHDEFGPLMFGLKAGADSLVRASAMADAARIAERARGMVAIVERMQAANRTLLRRIRPAALDHLSLEEAISSLAADLRQHDPSRTLVLRTGSLRAHYCEARDATLYRCVQEGLTNALKHGDARTIWITLDDIRHGAERTLRLVVTDDGSGPPARPVEGFGLAGMRERVRALGGWCGLERGECGGARLTVEIPVTIEEAGGA